MQPDNDNIPNHLPKKHPYTVPDRYFEELPMRVQQRVQRKPTFGGFSLPALQLQKVGLALASLLVIFAGVWFTLQQNTTVNQTESMVALSELSEAEVASYLTANFYQVDPADVAEIASPADFPYAELPDLAPADLADEIDYATLEEYYL